MSMHINFKEIELIASPALLLDYDQLTANILLAIKIAGSPDKLWPHVKSHKCRNIISLQISMGITRFKCATIAEAELCAMAGASTVLLAYPLVGPTISRFVQLIKKYSETRFIALADNIYTLNSVNQTAADNNLCIPYMLDVNTGLNRTGIPFQKLEDFLKSAAQMNNVHFFGIHCYDGERHETLLSDRYEAALPTVRQLQTALNKLGLSSQTCPYIIMGGSPSFPIYADCLREENIYYSPGTVFTYDAGYLSSFPDLPFRPAIYVLSRVISQPTPATFTIDAGYKSVSADQKIPGILPCVPEAVSLFQNEEHWTFEMKNINNQHLPCIGDIIYVLPWHICPTTMLYEHVYVFSNGDYKEKWKIEARDRFLTV